MKKPVFEKIKPLFQKKGKASAHGSYSAGYTALFLAVLLMGNLIVSRLPSKYTKIDLSGSGLYSIGDQTKAVLDGLSEDVTLYLVCQEGNEDSTVTHLLEQYAENSDHVTLETKDPVKSPTFTQTYTTDQVADNSVIVVSGDRSKVISYADIYTGDYDYSTGGYSSSFDGEGQLTSAIAYVTTDDLPVLYVVTGHDEAEISSTVRSTIEKENIRLEDLNLMTDTDVPEDAAGLFLYAPMSDYSEEEAAKIIAYLEKGGKSLIISSYTETELPNFQSILSAYGIRHRGRPGAGGRSGTHPVSESPVSGAGVRRQQHCLQPGKRKKICGGAHRPVHRDAGGVPGQSDHDADPCHLGQFL